MHKVCGYPILLLLCYGSLSTILGVAVPCGHNFMARLGSGIITSPNYPLNYSINGRTCNYRIYSQYVTSSLLLTATGHPENQLSLEDQTEAPLDDDKPRWRPQWKGVEDSKMAGTLEVVCFKFHRFRLADSPDNCEGYGNAYFEFPENVRYCNKGRLSTSSPQSAPKSVFEDSLCWPINSDYLEIKFSYPGSRSHTDTGFYATFNVSITDKGALAPSHNTTKLEKELCPDDHFTCFDDQSCVTALRTCNGKNDCADGSDEEYSHARCPGKQNYAGCDYELTKGVGFEFCNFTGIHWYRDRTSQYGPRYDHTIGVTDGPGHFVYNSMGPLDVSTLTSIAEVKVPKMPTHRCFRFWYFMSGAGMGDLSVFINSTAFTVAPNSSVWLREGHQASKWLPGEVDIPSNIQEITQLMFIVRRGRYADANIAIDDMSMSNGICYGDDISATFELGPGGWHLDDDTQYSPWTRRRGPAPLGPTTDCDGDGDGFYMYSEFSASSGYRPVRMVSRPLSDVPGSGLWCLSFCYHKFSRRSFPDEAILRIKVKYVDGTEGIIHWEDTPTGNFWSTRKFVMEKAYQPVQIIFEAEGSPHAEISIDNIVLIKDTCTSVMPTPPPTTATSVPITCSSRDYQCADGDCISRSRVCDGRFDCGDLSDERGCGYQGLSMGAVAGLICGVLVAFIIMLLSFIWARKRSAAARACSNARRPDVVDDEDFTEPMTYGEPPPLYSEIADDVSGNVSDSGAMHPLASHRHLMVFSLPWEPPPAYDVSPLPMLSTGPAVPCYSPRLDPPPFEASERQTHEMSSARRSISTDSKTTEEPAESNIDCGQSTASTHNHDPTFVSTYATDAVSQTPQDLAIPCTGNQIGPSEIVGAPALGPELQHYFNPRTIVYQVPNRYRRTFQRSSRRSFLRRSRRRSRRQSQQGPHRDSQPESGYMVSQQRGYTEPVHDTSTITSSEV